jgi:hypothetical protein
LLGAAAGDTGDRIEPHQRRSKRARVRLDPRIEERDLVLQESVTTAPVRCYLDRRPVMASPGWFPTA